MTREEDIEKLLVIYRKLMPGMSKDVIKRLIKELKVLENEEFSEILMYKAIDHARYVVREFDTQGFINKLNEHGYKVVKL